MSWTVSITVAHCEVGRLAPEEEIWVQCTMMAQQWAQEAQRDNDIPTLPPEYAQHQQVFNEEKAKQFLPEREGELEIPLMQDVPKVLDCKVYPLTKEEWDLLRTFLAEEQEKGYIYPGSSLYTVPVFFIGKKDSKEKRIVMDYRNLNKWTIWDNGPLPNI